MEDKVTLDTNLWVYLYAKYPLDKYLKVRELVSDRFEAILVSTQIIGELYHVLTRKKFRTKAAAQQIVLDIVANFLVVEIDTAKVVKAVEINSRYGYSYWDSLVVATALSADCSILYSEDLQHNQVIEKMRIVNPL